MEGFYTLLVTWVWLRSCPASRQVARGCGSFAVGRRMSEVFPEGQGICADRAVLIETTGYLSRSE